MCFAMIDSTFLFIKFFIFYYVCRAFSHRNIIPLIDRFCKHLFKIFKEIFKFVDILFKIPIAFFGFGNIAQKKQVKIVLKVESGFKFFGKSPNTYLH
jgi:hypothetical protein